jgi:hypothetical protein
MNMRTAAGVLGILSAAGRIADTRDLSVRVEPPAENKRETAVARTQAAIAGKWAGDNGRINQARAFLGRAKKSDARRRQEKASRKANRRRR